MTEVIRPKMHVWGPNRTQKVIFVDEAESCFEKGWRDHPNKVGLPLDPEDLKKLKQEAPKKGKGKNQ